MSSNTAAFFSGESYRVAGKGMRHRQQPLGLKTGVDGRQLGEALQHERGADQEHDRERHLHRDQSGASVHAKPP